VIYRYSLAQAMADGFVKEPAVATRADFNPAGIDKGDLERIMLEDGIHYHEHVRAKLETYALTNRVKRVHPFMLVVAADTDHARSIREFLESDEFFEGRYRGRVAEIHSKQSGTESDENAEKLLEIETSGRTDIVIHVNKLKEGWDVTNLYTIVPLRASASEILTEQTKIGPIKKFWRRLVDGAIGKLNGYYKVEDIYSKRTIEIAKSMGEYKELQIFAKELNENAKNSKEAIEYIKKIDENRGFLYTLDIKKIDLHSKYTIKNSERKEESLFTYKDFFTVKERLKVFLDGDIQVLKTTAGTFNEIIYRSIKEGKSEIDTIASLLSAITLSNEAGKYGRIPKARLPHALM